MVHPHAFGFPTALGGGNGAAGGVVAADGAKTTPALSLSPLELYLFSFAWVSEGGFWGLGGGRGGVYPKHLRREHLVQLNVWVFRMSPPELYTMQFFSANARCTAPVGRVQANANEKEYRELRGVVGCTQGLYSRREPTGCAKFDPMEMLRSQALPGSDSAVTLS